MAKKKFPVVSVVEPSSKAVFLDRDGVINKEVDHLRNIADFRLLPGVADAIKKINTRGYRVIVMTNQAAIAKGMLTEKKLEDIHAALVKRLEKRGAKLDGIYYCPHHPEGKTPKYRKACFCRKPEAGLILSAAKDMNLDLRKSFVVGDKTGDILSGEKAGAKTILVKTGYGGKDGRYKVKPDYIAKNLAEAVKFIHE